MFGWREKRPPASPWQEIAVAPANEVLILALRPKQMGTRPLTYYPAAARIGWLTSAGGWVDFTTGAPLDIEPDLFMGLPPLTEAAPILRFGKTRATRRAG